MVAQTRKIKADCGFQPGASSAPSVFARRELYQATRSLAADAVEVLAEGDVDLGEH